MRTEVVTISASASVRQLGDLLRRRRISGLPVVDEAHNVVGTVSVTDLAWLSDWFAGNVDGGSRRAGIGGHLDEKKVRDIMTPDVFGVEPDASLAELARFFSRTGLGRAVVLEGRRLVGIVSVIDLLTVIWDQSPADDG